jgi:hypothetical protein
MKHLNNEFGYAQFSPNEQQFAALIFFLSEKNITEKSAERAFVLDAFVSLRYEHDVCEAIGGDTGSKCPNSDGWKKIIETCPVAQALKLIYIDYMEQGFIHAEFLMVAWSIACDVQMSKAIGYG